MRYGVIGTGHWAREIHLAGLAAAPEDDLVGVWGRHPEKRQSLAQQFGVTAYDTPEVMFADVDVVAFAVPPDVQAPLAVRAAQAGCHLLLEKPTALSAEGASAVAAACAEAGVASVVFFTLRFDSGMAAWLATAQEAEGWEGMNATWLGNLFKEESPYRDSQWRITEGALWDLGPHALSMVLPLMGPVTDLVARRGRRDLVRMLLTHDGGATTSVLLSHTVDEAATKRGMEVFGPGGWSQMPAGLEPASAFQNAVTALGHAAATGHPHPCDAAFGAEVVALLAQAEASAG
ncbi:MAG TPA: Gfo/Idh/MocA family oxidoreductase [Euzebya sp.]|nr:Gfo/Idh/MocA family oxidoreductase [Euzebya sp.]